MTPTIAYQPIRIYNKRMIPYPNVFVGILIGIANNSFVAVFIAAFVWASVSMIVYEWILPNGRFQVYKENNTKNGLFTKQDTLMYYLTTFFTALITSFLVGLIIAFMKTLLTR
jgi:hypothetical protein